MPSILELKEKRGRLVKEALSLTKAKMNAETRARIDAIYADADRIKADIDRVEKAEQLTAEMRAVQSLPAGQIGSGAASEVAAAEKRERQNKAFDKFLRHGSSGLTAQESAELRDLSDSSGPAGAYTIAPAFSNKLEDALKFYGGARQVATVMKTDTGASLPWPTDNDTNNTGGLLNSEATPGTAGMQDVPFGLVTFGSYTFTTRYINVPNELLQDSAFDLQAFIQQKFVQRIGRSQNGYFTVGTGVNQPTGFITAAVAAGDTLTAATGSATSITFSNLVNLIHQVDPAYRDSAKWTFHDTTLAALRKMVDTQGRPLLGLGLNGGDPDRVLGYEYVLNNDVPRMSASAPSIAFGALDKFVVRDVADLSILRLNELRALQNQTAYVGFSRADSNLLDAGTHPIAVYVNSAS